MRKANMKTVLRGHKNQQHMGCTFLHSNKYQQRKCSTELEPELASLVLVWAH